MNHRTIERLLSAYLDGELADRQGREVAEHLRACEGCGIRLEELRTIRRQIQSAANLALPENFVYGVLRAARSEKESTLVWLGAERFARNVVVVLTVVVLFLIGLASYLRPEPPVGVDRYFAGEPTDSLTRQVLEKQGEISKDDVVFAALTK